MPTKQRFARIILLLLLPLLFALPAAAQGGDPKEQLTKELWCPICNGIRLDVCEQKVCEQMRTMIDDELAAGTTPEQIKAKFIDLYGPVVLGEPPREGFNLIAWVLPIVLLAGGIAVAIWLTRQWSNRGAAPASPASSPASSPPDDDYLARVEREVSEP